MRLPIQASGARRQNFVERSRTGLQTALARASVFPAGNGDGGGCQRFVSENPGPAAAIAQHPNAGFTKFTATGISAIDATAAALDKCGFWACQNSQDATKCSIEASSQPPLCGG